MLPDYLLSCTVCGSEALWDTDQLPPAGIPRIGDPVLWSCATCGSDRRHVIADLHIFPEKVRHAVSVATEIDCQIVDRVMAATDRLRRSGTTGAVPPDASDDISAVAAALGVPPDTVDRIAVAEATWLCRHGYIQEIGAER